MRRLLILPVLLLAFLLAPPASTAGELTGSWVYAGGADEEAARDAAIEASVAKFGRVIRRIARSRLKASMITPESYDLTDGGDHFVIALDGGPARRTDLAGTPIEFEPDGKDVTVSLVRTRAGDAIHLVATTEKGVITSDFARVGDLLAVDITIANSRLDVPLQYRLTYRRK